MITNKLLLLAILSAAIATCPAPLLSEEPRPTIAVVGHAQIVLPADVVTITATIEGQALQAEKAFDIVDKQSQDISAFLQQSGVPDTAVRMHPIMVALVYQRIDKVQMQRVNKSQPARPDNGDQSEANADGSSFQAKRQFHITLADIKKLNTVQLGLIQRGIRKMDRIEFKSSKSQQEYPKLRLAAVRDAHTKATAMAGELGAELSSIKSMVDQSSLDASNLSLTIRSNDNNPFDDGGMGGSAVNTVNSSTIVTHVATVNIVFYLGKTELAK